MIGFRVSLTFERGTPRALLAVFYVFLGNFLVFMICVAYATFAAPRVPSDSHSYPWNIRRGTLAYVSNPLGHYMRAAIVAHGIFLATYIAALLGYWFTGRATLASRR